MENRTQFNLNQSVNNWKTSLSKSGAMTNDNILELESHLLDEIDQLKTQELNEEECFLIARKRIGNLDSLKSEFEKVNVNKSFLHKVTPYLKGILAYLSFISISKILFSFIILIALKLGFGVLNYYIMIGIIVAVVILFISIIKSPMGANIINRLNKVSILLLLTFLSKPIEISMQAIMTRYIGFKTYGLLNLNFSIFHLTVFGLVIIFSIIVIINMNKSNKLILQK